jgi:glycosyltransferase involved in cell wall biosynthesis
MRVAVVMWPDTFEDWYGPQGITREAFLDGYEGEWSISFAMALRAAGHEVHLVFGSRHGSPSAVQEPSGATVHFVGVPPAYRALLHATWGAHPVRALEKVWPAAPALAALSPALVRRVKSLRPDSVLVQDYETVRFDVVAPLLRVAGLRTVGLDTGGSARPASAPWKRLTRRRAHDLLAVNQREADRLRAAGHHRVGVWPVPVRTDVFAPADRAAARRELGVPADARFVFSAGRLHPVKNLPVLADVCAGFGVGLVLSGEGTERAALEAKGHPGLRLLGRMPVHTVARWYAACDVVALASHQEGQPVAVLEALACGRGVVTTNVGGLEQAVGDRGAGWLVPPRDPAALEAALAEALSDRGEADARGARGRAYVVGAHSLAAVGDWFARRLSGSA